MIPNQRHNTEWAGSVNTWRFVTQSAACQVFCHTCPIFRSPRQAVTNKLHSVDKSWIMLDPDPSSGSKFKTYCQNIWSCVILSKTTGPPSLFPPTVTRRCCNLVLWRRGSFPSYRETLPMNVGFLYARHTCFSFDLRLSPEVLCFLFWCGNIP